MNIVASRTSDPRSFMFTPYEPSPLSNKKYPCARVNPDIWALSPLAQFLAGNVSHTHRHRGALIVRLLSRTTQAELIRRAAAEKHYACGTTFIGPNAAARALKRADSIIRMHSLERKESSINDWDFSLLEIDETPEQYFEQEARKIIATGAYVVEVSYPLTDTVVFLIGGKDD